MRKCKICNCDLSDEPMHFGCPPPAFKMVPEEEYKKRVCETEDHCIIDGKHFLIRGLIELSVQSSDDKLIWSVWVSVNERDFNHICENWEVEGREKISSYFGCLTTCLPCYQDTRFLEVMVRSQSVGHIPLVEVKPSDHPLFIEQRSGISLRRAHEILHHVMQH